MSHKKILERDVVRAIRASAKEHGCIAIRLSLMPYVEAGWPDFLLINKSGDVLFIEAKSPTGKLTEKQKAAIERLRKHKVKVEVVRAPHEAREVILGFSRSSVD